MKSKAAAKTERERWSPKETSDKIGESLATVYRRIENGSYTAYRVASKIEVDAESVRDFHSPKLIVPKAKRPKSGRDSAAHAAA